MKSKSRRDGSRSPGELEPGETAPAPTKRCDPTLKTYCSGATNDCTSNPASSNHSKMAGVRSGGRRCRVQSTVAPGADSDGRLLIVDRMSSSLMLPNTPQTSTRSAGKAWPYSRGHDASPSTTVTWPVYSRRLGPVASERHELGIELHQDGPHVRAPSMAGDHVDHVAPLSGAETEHADGPRRALVEGRPHSRLHVPQSGRVRGAGILVGPMPTHPVRFVGPLRRHRAIVGLWG